MESERRKMLERRWSYFNCSQHDGKRYDFNGMMLNGTGQAAQPLMQASPVYVPLIQRRPSSPYRLARVIVTSFTSMLFGEHRFPKPRTTGDSDSEDWLEAFFTEASIPARFSRMRNLGGATGTACCSWGILSGKPRVRVHNAKNIFVHSWEDRDECIPRHVTECFKYDREVFDNETGRLRKIPYWYRRDWTKDSDVAFVSVPVQAGSDPEWKVDDLGTYAHKDGICHFVMGQNLPDDDFDGEPDYEGQYDSFDTLDVMLSILARGAILNLDPTLKLKMDPDLVGRMGVKKGSDNSLVVGEEGDAEYMELAGTSIEAGINLFNKKRGYSLESVQCVLPDPDEVGAGITSAAARKIIYTPMLNRTDDLRTQYGGILRRLTEPFLTVSRHKHGSRVFVFERDAQGEVVRDEHGEPRTKEVEVFIDLPPRVIEGPPGEDGKPSVKLVERKPGTAEHVEPKFPDEYFLPTPEDQAKAVTTLTTAAGGPGTAILSKRTATKLASETMGVDPDAEIAQMAKEQSDVEQKQGSMFADQNGAMGGGGSVKRKVVLPDGSSVEHSQEAPPPPDPNAGGGDPSLTIHPPAPPDPQTPGDTQIPVTPSATQAVVTVNELRKSMGLEAYPGDDGNLPVTQFMAKYAKPIATAENAALGKLGVTPGAPPKPAPGAPGAGPPKPPGAGPPGAPPPLGGPPKPPSPLVPPLPLPPVKK
jgi:hypothetical protein